MKVLQLLIVLISLWSFFSCNKEEGLGGYAKIEGKVLAKDYGTNGLIHTTYYIPDQRVYIVYGDNNVYNDDIETNYDGTYLFEYLKKGTYTIFTYSDCHYCISGDSVVKTTINIEDKREDLIIPELEIYKDSKGKASITGRIFAHDYKDGVLIGSYYEAKENVYLIHGNESFYSDDVQTNYDGTYKFDNLKKGNYTVYVYTDCNTCPSGDSIMQRKIELTEVYQQANLPDIEIRK